MKTKDLVVSKKHAIFSDRDHAFSDLELHTRGAPAKNAERVVLIAKLQGWLEALDWVLEEQ